jgi:hypothetical protein
MRAELREGREVLLGTKMESEILGGIGVGTWGCWKEKQISPL